MKSATVVTQYSSGALRDDTKNGCVADYPFCHPGCWCVVPHTPTPKCSCTLATLNINLSAEQKLKVLKHIKQEIFGRESGSSIRSFRSVSFPAPPLLMSDLGWPKSWLRLGVPWSVVVGTWWGTKWLGLCSYTVWLCFMALWYVFFCCWVLLGTLRYREEESDEKNVGLHHRERGLVDSCWLLCFVGHLFAFNSAHYSGDSSKHYLYIN